MATIGGGTIKSYEFTRSWGINPAQATGVAVIDSSSGGSLGLTVGQSVVFSFGSVASFAGVMHEVGARESAGTGTEYSFVILDNRLRLGGQFASVQGAWNLPDDRWARRIDMPIMPAIPNDSSGPAGGDDMAMGAGVSDPVATPEVTIAAATADNPLRSRRYKHLLPEHVRAGLFTYSDEPLSAREILNSAFGGAWGEFSFSRDYHPAMDDVFPMGLDVSSGTSLASLISQICELCGLEMKLEGWNNLEFGRKGDGLAPLPDAFTGPRQASESLNPNPSKVRVVGDPFRAQVHNIELVPDWKEGWQAWIDELAWVRKVGEVFELPAATKADLAERAAFAKEVSVAQFVAKTGVATLADHRRFGAISRMAMPAWSYITNLVYRSYRIPQNYTLGGIPLASLRWASSMLAGVGIKGEGEEAVQALREDDPELYPDSRVHVIVQGQPLDLIDARSIALFSERRNRDLRSEWTPWPEVEIDDENWSIRFPGPIFIDGDPALGESVLLRVNAGEGDDSVDLSDEVVADSEYLDVVVPNPAFSITPANVKIALCFEFGRFQQDFGTGPRRMVVPQSGIGMELVETSEGAPGLGAFLSPAPAALLPFPSPAGLDFSEIEYADGGQATDKAEEVANSFIQKPVLQVSGGFTRHGVVGTQLTTAVDRVTIRINDDGVSEEIEYSKASPTKAFVAERTLTRLTRAGDLFPGAEETRNEIRQLRMFAGLERAAAKDGRRKTHLGMPDLMARPVGDEAPSTETIYDKNSQAPTVGEGSKWRAGDLVWRDKQGFPSRTGDAFMGVVVVTPGNVGEAEQAKDLTVATRGTVPVRVKGGIKAGGTVFAESGDSKGSASGSVIIGRLMHGEDVPTVEGGEVLARVHLGSGGKSSVRFEFLGLVKNEDDVWCARLGPGCVFYHMMTHRGDFEKDDSMKAQYCRGIFPTIEVSEGNKVRIDDPSNPALPIGEREDATLWLVVKKERCAGASSLDSEKIVISDRGDKPEIENWEDAYQIVDFDIETADGAKRAKEVFPFLQSDHVQDFLCDKSPSSEDSVDDSEFGPSFEDSFSPPDDSTPSNSSDDEEDPDGDCRISVAAGWENAVVCFPNRTGLPAGQYDAAPFDFKIRVQFFFHNPFTPQCTGYVYGVRLEGGTVMEGPNGRPPGSTTTEHIWKNDTERKLDFTVEHPPACGTIKVHWRVRTLGAVSGFGGAPPEEQGCCDRFYSGTTTVVLRDSITVGYWNKNKTKLPPVCGSSCSSSVVGGSSDSDSGSEEPPPEEPPP